MTNISLPLPQKQLDFIERMLRYGDAETRVELIRKALKKYEEDKIIEIALKSEHEAREGKVFGGDIKEIAKKFKKLGLE